MNALASDSSLRMPDAQLALGQMFLDRQDYTRALDCFTAAARGQDARAFNMLGRCHERGWGVNADSSKAAACYRKAADLGDTWAKFNLADLYCRGDGVEHDVTAAWELYREAAAAGHLKSLNMLGLLLEDGVSGKPDLTEARALYRAGAEGGDCWAGFNYARLALDTGDDDDAVRVLEQALQNGFPDFYRHVAEQLSGHRVPAIAAIARQAGILPGENQK